MTDQELLQQAKDQVAEETRLMKPWSQIVDDNHSSGHFIERLMDHVCKKAIQSAIEEAAPKWIPVSERLPETGQRVLLSRPQGVMLSLFHPHYPLSDAGVTHWMPAPEEVKLTAPGR